MSPSSEGEVVIMAPQPPASPSAKSNAGVESSSSSSLLVPDERSLLTELRSAELRLKTGTLDLDSAIEASDHGGSGGGAASGSGDDFAALACGPFLSLLQSELDRCGSALRVQLDGIEDRARTLHNEAEASLERFNADGVDRDGFPSPSKAAKATKTNNGGASRAAREEASRMRSSASAVVSSLRAMNLSARRSAAVFRRIAMEADARLTRTSSPSSPRVELRSRTKSCRDVVEGTLRRTSGPWSNARTGGTIVALLSDIYAMARTMDGTTNAGGGKGLVLGSDGKWVAPDAFERKTHKYWADEDRLAEVMAACVKEIPLLVYGKKGNIAPKKPPKSSISASQKTWDVLATPINNIYFDNQINMPLYRERIMREEGARLIRLRWYGDDRPKGDDMVFLEMKTHHMKWVNMKSVKRRVSVLERDVVPSLLDFSRPLTPALASEIVTRANPSLNSSAKKRSKSDAVNLLLECRALIEELNLKPCVRTRYLRTAFQSSESNALRVTVDRDVELTDVSGTPAGKWCQPSNTPLDSSTQVVKMPCAIIEVKLAGEVDMPDFVYDLEADGVVEDGHKFSKYLTGGAVFFPDGVNMMPYWADVPLFASVFAATRRMTKTEAASPRNSPAEGEKDGIARRIRIRGRRSSVSRSSATGGTSRSSGAYPALPYSSWAPDGIGGSSSRPAPLLEDGFLEEDIEGGDHEGKGGKQRGFLGVGAAAGGLRRRHGEHDEEAKGTKKQGAMIAPRRQVKVEPKSYFANERTFIQWSTSAVLMVTLSVVLFDYGTNDASVMGLVLCALGMAMILYALMMYYRRIKLMESRKNYGYVDHVGPAVLTGAILLGVTAFLVFHFRAGGAEAAKAAKSGSDADGIMTVEKTMTSLPSQCDLLDTSSMPALEYQPSDALVDETRMLLLVPSLGLITALPLYPNDDDNGVQVVAKVDGADFEALVYVGDVLYAASEGNGQSELFAFEWTGDFGFSLSLVKSWKISSPAVEGLAYVPGLEDEKDGKLYVASHKPSSDSGTEIDIYDVPYFGRFSSTPQAQAFNLSPIGRLNDDLMFHGLDDATISSMTYFEETLYVLHGDAKVLRSWDLRSGKRRGPDVALPAVSGGFGNQWEGIGFLRMPPAEAGTETMSLRGSSADADASSQLKVYLALDTPPQVWSIQVQGVTNSTWEPPECFAS